MGVAAEPIQAWCETLCDVWGKQRSRGASRRINNGQASPGHIALRLYNRYTHCPWARPAHVAESGRWTRLQVLQNSGSQMWMVRVKTLSARDRHWQNAKKIKRAQQNQSACVSALMALCHTLAKWQRGGRESFSTMLEWNPCSVTHWDPVTCLNITYQSIQHRSDLKYFLMHNFCSLLIEQLINLNLRKVRNENLNFRQIFEN